MVGNLACGIFNPAYSPVVTTSAMVEDDGLGGDLLATFVRGGRLRFGVGFDGLPLFYGVRLGLGGQIRQGRHWATL